VKVNLHPDDSFVEYVDFKTGLPTFTMEEATIGNRLMDECFDVCKENSADIYELAMLPLLNSVSNSIMYVE
jgi:hypothetical protein